VKIESLSSGGIGIDAIDAMRSVQGAVATW
jgi:hypothetical protein